MSFFALSAGRMIAQVLAHSIRAIADGLHGLLQPFGRGVQAFAPIPNLVLLVNVNALAILAVGL
jgi:hypothetical protein